MRIIAGSARGHKLESPKGLSVRPTSDLVRGALFNILGQRLDGKNFLDLCSGSGGIGLEALSRGAYVTMVEKDPSALAVLRINLAKCGFKNYTLTPTDVLRFVRHLKNNPPNLPFDIIFADPPYASELAANLLEELSPDCLTPEGLLVIEHRRHEPPNCPADTCWIKEREAVYGKTALSFYRPKR